LAAALQSFYGSFMSGPDTTTERERKARQSLDGLDREGDLFSGSLRRTAAYFSAREAPADDGIERWGCRIGRTLSAIAVVILCVYLALTYLR
jgi:hypothetical protein